MKFTDYNNRVNDIKPKTMTTKPNTEKFGMYIIMLFTFIVIIFIVNLFFAGEYRDDLRKEFNKAYTDLDLKVKKQYKHIINLQAEIKRTYDIIHNLNLKNSAYEHNVGRVQKQLKKIEKIVA